MFINRSLRFIFWIGITILFGIKGFETYSTEYLSCFEKSQAKDKSYLFLEEELLPALKNTNYKGIISLIEPSRFQQIPARGFEVLYRKTAQALGSFVSTESLKEAKQGLLGDYKRSKRFFWSAEWTKTKAIIEIDLIYKRDRWWIHDIVFQSEKLEQVNEAARQAFRTGVFDENFFYQSLSGLR